MLKNKSFLAISLAILFLAALGYLGFRIISSRQKEVESKDTISCKGFDDCQWYKQVDVKDTGAENARVLCGNKNFIKTCENCSLDNSAAGTGSLCICNNKKCEIIIPAAPTSSPQATTL